MKTSQRDPYDSLPETTKSSRRTYREWTIDVPTTRNFDCEIIDRRLPHRCKGEEGPARWRLRLSATSRGENYLTILVPTLETMREVNRMLGERGLSYQQARGVRSLRYGTWRRYLREVALAHAAIEILGWKLTDKEQALMDALDAFGRNAPARVCKAA